MTEEWQDISIMVEVVRCEVWSCYILLLHFCACLKIFIIRTKQKEKQKQPGTKAYCFPHSLLSALPLAPKQSQPPSPPLNSSLNWWFPHFSGPEVVRLWCLSITRAQRFWFRKWMGAQEIAFLVNRGSSSDTGCSGFNSRPPKDMFPS